MGQSQANSSSPDRKYECVGLAQDWKKATENQEQLLIRRKPSCKCAHEFTCMEFVEYLFRAVEVNTSRVRCRTQRMGISMVASELVRSFGLV